MKATTLFHASILLAFTLLTISCASNEAVQDEKQDNENNAPAGSTMFSGDTHPSTRTSIVDHIKDGGAKVNWSTADKIWAKDNTNTWHESGTASFHELPNKSKAMFALNGTYSNATHEVVYTNIPITGTPQVEIKATQTQTTPNNFDHAGASGDCGVATAKGSAAGYGFHPQSQGILYLPDSTVKQRIRAPQQTHQDRN